ncbi:proteasome subunit beta type-1-B-like [Paramacrobiotus metropolitanus]|uniref:proteasome subunit beta type-1-B-like n=1 Tax=Paramacrobiotus metropolitanus TaxID=2943436 RepID=UPI002445DE60|nr:proteasome subunit beta type-1-B-like [Paramacrobiotus metropolitanus]
MGDFNPYDDNGGTVAAIAGQDYVLVACDSRLSTGSTILSRVTPKIYPLSKQTVFACAGFHADVLTLVKNLEVRMKLFVHEHGEEMSTKAMMALMLPTLYGRRFFPFYVRPIVAGLDRDGRGLVASYDPVGTPEFFDYVIQGSAENLVHPFLHNQIGMKRTLSDVPIQAPPELTMEKAIKLIKDSYLAAAERDVYTGDTVTIMALTKDGTNFIDYQLRRD